MGNWTKARESMSESRRRLRLFVFDVGAVRAFSDTERGNWIGGTMGMLMLSQCRHCRPEYTPYALYARPVIRLISSYEVLLGTAVLWARYSSIYSSFGHARPRLLYFSRVSPGGQSLGVAIAPTISSTDQGLSETRKDTRRTRGCRLGYSSSNFGNSPLLRRYFSHAHGSGQSTAPWFKVA